MAGVNISEQDSTATSVTVVEHVDPRTLLVNSNIRTHLNLTPDFLASIRDNGVLVPLTVVRTVDGDLRVRFGGRRTAAAVEVGLATVPITVAADEGTDDAATIERLVTQYAENEHRAGLSGTERRVAIEQMAMLGVKPTQISKRLRAPRADVDAAIAISLSPVARDALDQHQLDLTQAAVLADFEDDENAVAALIESVETGEFAHVAQHLRDERDERERYAAATAKLTGQGLTVVDYPAWDAPTVRLSHLLDADGGDLTAEAHAACPGHVAYVHEAWGWTHPGTGDELTSHDELGDVEPVRAQIMQPVFCCTDPSTHGHKPRFSSGASGKPKVGDMTEEQREKAREERRDVIDSNKAWDSAETVRRDWLRTFLSRKTAPKTTGRFLVTALASADHALTQALTDGHRPALELLGLTAKKGGARRNSALEQALSDANEARAQVIHLGLVLAAYEAATHRNSWRSVDSGTTAYLTFLADNGYTLSAVERRACGLKPDRAATAA